MKLTQVTALITGASGGIGAAIAKEIIGAGGRALITGRNERVLEELAGALDSSGARVLGLATDICSSDGRRRLIEVARHWRGGVNVLINAAGRADFGMFAEERSDDVDAAFEVNVLAPIKLCRGLLPHLRRLPEAHIVNIGSVFGAIGYPGQAVYSATKFALRGFSEALRRELCESGVRVHYLAPRATRTAFNSSAVNDLNAALGVAVDPPARVAARLRRMLEHNEAEAVVGWPEQFFARVNALLPRIVDTALRKQLPIIRQHAAARTESPPGPVTVSSMSRKAS